MIKDFKETKEIALKYVIEFCGRSNSFSSLRYCKEDVVKVAKIFEQYLNEK